MKFGYQTKFKQYNDQSHLVCVEHGFFSKQNTHLNQEDSAERKLKEI